jgi:hypothetical protein
MDRTSDMAEFKEMARAITRISVASAVLVAPTAGVYALTGSLAAAGASFLAVRGLCRLGMKSPTIARAAKTYFLG